jgi:hypothetical protein
MFTLGADPEIFVTKDGKPVSAHGLIGGSKSEPLKTSKGAVQVDGMALEFNIDPTDQGNFEGFNENIVRTMRDLKDMVPGYSFNISPVQDFGEEGIKAAPPEALILGCDPDYNAYTLEANPMPDGTRTFRTGAGHIHFGWSTDIPVDNKEHIEICGNFIKMLDATVGMAMTFLDRDPRRRELYGKAGAFRPKSYGVEYRTPSNVWIKNRNRRKLIHDLCNLAIRQMCNGVSHTRVTGHDVPEEIIVEIINTGDWFSASTMVQSMLYRSTVWKSVTEEKEFQNG